MTKAKSVFKAIEQFINDGYRFVEYRNALNGNVIWSGSIMDTPFHIHRNYTIIDYCIEPDQYGYHNLVVYLDDKDWLDKH